MRLSVPSITRTSYVIVQIRIHIWACCVIRQRRVRKYNVPVLRNQCHTPPTLGNRCRRKPILLQRTPYVVGSTYLEERTRSLKSAQPTQHPSSWKGKRQRRWRASPIWVASSTSWVGFEGIRVLKHAGLRNFRFYV